METTKAQPNQVKMRAKLSHQARFWVFIVVALGLLTGCERLKEGFKAAVRQVASSTPLGVTARVDVTPVNADQVARFADEKELADEDPLPLPSPVTNVSEEPGSSQALVVLPKDHRVTKIARRNDAFLVVFENPQKPEEMLMGWVDASALSEQSVQAAKPEVATPTAQCEAGQERLAGDPEFCARVCSSDAGCEAEERCTGIARLSDNGAPGLPVRFCVAKLVKKAEFVDKPAKASIKKPEPAKVQTVAAPTPTVVSPERCSPTCTATCDCAGRPRVAAATSERCSPTCTATCDCAGRPRAAAAEERCSPTCTATCDCSGRPIKCSPTCTETCDCAGRPITCAPTCTDTCDCAGRPRKVAKCSPTCTATCDCSGRPIKCSPTCTETCDCAGRPITCAPTCTDTCDCAGRPRKVAKCSPTCTATCDCSGRPIKCSPTCTETCDCSGNPIVKVRKGAAESDTDKPRRRF